MSARLAVTMRGARPGPLPVFLGFLALLTLLGGSGVSASPFPVSGAHGVAGSVGISASLPGGDAVLGAKPKAREGAWGQRVRLPRTLDAFMALAIGGAVALIRRRRWCLDAGRLPLVATRRAGGVRAPPLLQPA
jgi:hypothetical protein